MSSSGEAPAAAPLAASSEPKPASIPSQDDSDAEDTPAPSIRSQISLPSPDNGEAAERQDDDYSIASSTTSLSSSIYEHVEENGRTYHRYKEGKYPLPNDLQEQKRLTLQHTLFGITLAGKLHLAPLPDKFSGRVLDIATGTGIWPIEFASVYPDAQITGTDLSPIQPEFIPDNVTFIIDDAEDEWTFSHPFDYIHGRALLSCFTDPRSVIASALAALAPGGHLELQDGYFPFQYAGPAPTHSHLYTWADIVTHGAARSGRPWTNAASYARWMRELGFVDVVEKKFFWPTSPWAKGHYYKQVATYFQEDMLQGLEGISLRVMGALGWQAKDVKEFLVKVRQDFRDTRIHAYLPIVVVYGRKPVAVDSAD